VEGAEGCLRGGVITEGKIVWNFLFFKINEWFSQFEFSVHDSGPLDFEKELFRSESDTDVT